jgi:hypothetical protein
VRKLQYVERETEGGRRKKKEERWKFLPKYPYFKN